MSGTVDLCDIILNSTIGLYGTHLNGTQTVISALRVYEVPLLKSYLIVINSQNVCSQTVWTKLTLNEPVLPDG